MTQPDQPKPEITAHEIFAGMFGLDHDTTLADEAANLLMREVAGESAEAIAQRLAEASVEIDARTIPEYLKPEELTDEDIRLLQNSPTPLITLYGIANAYHVRHDGTGWKVVEDKKKWVDQGNIYEDAKLRSLPLVHGTSLDGLRTIMAHGGMVSNREVYEQSGDAQAFIDSEIGATNLWDRKLGLDRYVFADFARPSRIRPPSEVEIVIDPSAMEEPGAFLTEQDYQDCEDSNKTPQDAMRDYMRGAQIPERFYKAARERILIAPIGEREYSSGGGYRLEIFYNTIDKFIQGQDMQPQPMNPMVPYKLSTWEVKLPSVTVDSIRRLVVHSQEVFDQVVEEFGDIVEVVLATQFGPRNYESLQLPGAYEQALEENIENDYAERVARIEQADPDDRETVVVVMQKGSTSPDDLEKYVELRTNPAYKETAAYKDMAQLIDDVRQTDPNYDRHFGRSHMNKRAWFARFADTGREDRDIVVAEVERLKSDPKVGRITSISTINPTKI